MISIVIPTYKRFESLTATLKSLNAQTLSDFEVVVVNDDPESKVQIDGTEYKYALKILNNSQNLGAAGARNRGVRESKGEWIAFLDDDDFFLPDKLEYLTSKIKEHPDVQFFYHPILYEFVNEGVKYETTPNVIAKPEDVLTANIIGGPPGFFIRKDVFLSLNGFDVDMVALEDYEFVIRIVRGNIKTMFLSVALSRCQAITRSIGLSKSVNKIQEALRYLDNAYQNEYKQLAPHLDRKRKANGAVQVGFAYLLNLQRKAGNYYLRAFLHSFDLKYLVAAGLSWLNPTFLIKMKGRMSGSK
ncbi:Glycosyltransferase, GT2 family [Chitinophaga terrae (ex Kim and Jung 2007)]|uniref:Glycosyltransferase, GT2 family n=1 Tax=Chitinophaga terrae (ex Kim and Jung 2007) TaxID=408074 RepID=A0A1H3XZB2_9BACT|nr:glycosyltransferase family 2 protein [Chitinophaga terrae (ex Kim and Jung 2007)]GEP89457.1 hypothetical protein CTE07_11020 [Chitinophaga terrae (ex Kim and Jung 2007)]SEA04181.1 Glycosyltransferase, GT2 family [Chitinophaga terrae (ex Kim and Jung 2007)]